MGLSRCACVHASPAPLVADGICCSAPDRQRQATSSTHCRDLLKRRTPQRAGVAGQQRAPAQRTQLDRSVAGSGATRRSSAPRSACTWPTKQWRVMPCPTRAAGLRTCSPWTVSLPSLVALPGRIKVVVPGLAPSVGSPNPPLPCCVLDGMAHLVHMSNLRQSCCTVPSHHAWLLRHSLPACWVWHNPFDPVDAV